MAYRIIKDDISELIVDVVVNPTDSKSIGLGGVEGKLLELGGHTLRDFRSKVHSIPVTEVIVSSGYDLNAKYVFHTVGPTYVDSKTSERELRRTYQNIFQNVIELGVESIAIPLISAGYFGYPTEDALKISLQEIEKHNQDYDTEVHLVVYDEESFTLSKELRRSINEFLEYDIDYSYDHISKSMSLNMMFDARKLDISLEETFSESLLRLIDERGLRDSDVYKQANIDRKHFSKIKNNKNYKPTKNTVLAFAIALKLNKDETEDLLETAGYTLSRSILFDQIIEYCLLNNFTSIHDVNLILFDYDQKTLGMS